jgi:hypothetical protein
MLRIVYIVLSTLCVLGCIPKSEEKIVNNAKKIKIDYNPDEMVISTDIIDSVAYIPLVDTDEPLGNIGKMIIESNKILLWDKSLNCIWAFDTKGNFISKISKSGSGPGEYNSLQGFSFTPPNSIHINDSQAKKIRTYSLSGEFLGEENTDGYVTNYLEYNNMKLFFNHYFEDVTEGKFYFNVINHDGTSVGFFNYENPFTFFGNGGDFIIKSNESVYLTLPYYDTIYSLENFDKLITKYILDFGNNHYPTKDLYKADNITSRSNILSKGGYIGNPSNVILSNKYMVLNYSQQIDSYSSNVATLIYNTATDKFITYSVIDRGTHDIHIGHPMTTDGESFYSLKYSHEVPDTLMKVIKNGDSDTQENSNPIVIKYSYKI